MIFPINVPRIQKRSGTWLVAAKLKLAGIFLTAAIATLVSVQGTVAGTWSPVASTAPGGVSLMLLLSDGTVMCQNSGNVEWYRLTPDNHGSYVNGTWSTLAPMHNSRRYYSSQVLRDGRVFVCGGEYGTGNGHAETYDPVNNLWTQEPDPGINVIDNNSETLPNGDVLEPSLATGKPCLIFNIISNTWTNAAVGYDGQDEAAWVKLPDASILTIDPFGQNSERYIPSLNLWVKDSTVPVSMYGYGGELGAGFLLPNGNAFFIGATNHTAIYTPSGTTNAGVWTAGATIPNNLGAVDAPSAMMVNGNILCALGTNTGFGSVTYFYEYNYVSNTFSQVGSPTGGTTANVSPYGTTMLDLPDGTVLYSGFGSQLYDYQPGGTPLTNGMPTILSVTTNLDGSFQVTGTLLNGISEGAAYGDDSQMVTARPIARMTNGVNVLYCRTYNWSTCNVATGTNVLTTDMTLPAGLLAGTYPLVVTANGISSAPYSLTIPGTPLPAVTDLAFTTVISNQMAFRWNAIDLTETGYVVQRSTDGVNYSTLTILSGAPTNYTDSTVTPLGEYYYRVMGTNSVGLGLASGIFAASPSMTPLSAPWQSGDIGAVQGGGASGTNASAFTVISSGAGIGSDNDQFQFVYQPMAGDVTVTARVLASQNTGSNAMAGVMIRNSLGNDVASALMAFDSGVQASVFVHRADAAGLATYGLKLYGEPEDEEDSSGGGGSPGNSGMQFGSNNISAPVWVRLVRSGNTIAGFISSDGINWKPQGTTTLDTAPVVYAGLAVSSGTYNLLNASSFDNVTVIGTAAAVPPPVAEWKLDEINSTNAEDSIDSFDGLYNNVVLGQPGATPDTGYSAEFNGTNANISIPPLNLNGNALTITAWVNRNGNQNSWSGIFFDRESSTANGLHFGTANELRYTWNNSSGTYNWNSGLVPPANQWAFVALVIEPTRARIYLATNGVLVSATNNVPNPVQGFAGNSYIGQDTTSSSRYFNGLLDQVTFYNQALSGTQISQLATPPVVTFSAPANGEEFSAPGTVNLAISATGTNGHVVNLVQFFNGDDLVGEATTAPYANAVTNLVSGSYSFSARMYYDSGLEVDSDPVNVVVESAPATPLGVVATAVASNLVYISWLPSAGADGYVLNRNGSPVVTLAGPCYVLDANLVPNTSYCYSVVATNQVGISATSVSSCVTTLSAISDLVWDAGSSGDPQDGNGTWGAAATWWNSSQDVGWTDGNLAVFGAGVTTNCTVTLANNTVPKGILFNPANGGHYVITSSTTNNFLMLSGTVPVIANGDATISAYLGGAGVLVKSGPGVLTIAGGNTNTGATIVAGGKLLVTGGGWYANRGIGSGALTVSNDATAEFTQSHGFGESNYGQPATINNGTLQLDGDNYFSGMTLTAGIINGASGHYLAPISGMTCTVNASPTGSMINTPTLSLQGPVTFNVARGTSGADLQITGGVVSGAGPFTKSGAGILQFGSTSSYTGTTTVSAGSLQVDGSLGTNSVSVNNNAVLAGTGAINGHTTVLSGGTLAPGDGGIGTLFFSANLTLNPSSKTVLELNKTVNGLLDNDLVSVLGTLMLGGTLIVTNIGTNALAAGDSFNLLDATAIAGNFSTETLPALPPGLVWDTSQLTNNGIITVAAPPAVIPLITNAAAFGNGGFTLGGTGGVGQTCILLGASNLAPPVVWLPVQTNTADTNGVFNFNDLQSTNYVMRFYRIMTP